MTKTILAVVVFSGLAFAQLPGKDGPKWFTTIATTGHLPQWIAASTVLELYQANEMKGDRLMKGKELRVLGKAARVKKDLLGRPTLFLGDSELRSIRCIFEGDLLPADEDALAMIDEGQLVAVTGVGEGKALTQVSMGKCHVNWMPSVKTNARLIGMSLATCTSELFASSFSGEKLAQFEKHNPGSIKKLQAQQAEIDRWLKTEKPSPLSCKDDSLWVAFSCDGNPSAECKSPILREILKNQPR